MLHNPPQAEQVRRLIEILRIDTSRCGATTTGPASRPASRPPCKNRTGSERVARIELLCRDFSALAQTRGSLEAWLDALLMEVACYHHRSGHHRDERLSYWIRMGVAAAMAPKAPARNVVAISVIPLISSQGPPGLQSIADVPPARQKLITNGQIVIDDEPDSTSEDEDSTSSDGWSSATSATSGDDDVVFEDTAKLMDRRYCSGSSPKIRILKRTPIVEESSDVDNESETTQQPAQCARSTSTAQSEFASEIEPSVRDTESTATPISMKSDREGSRSELFVKQSSRSRLAGVRSTPKSSACKNERDETAFSHVKSYAPPSTVAEIRQRIAKCAMQELSSQDLEIGYIYAFTVPGNDGFIKIGVTTDSVAKRLQRWKSSCGREPQLLYPADPRHIIPTAHAHRVERLIHAELSQDRVLIPCAGCSRQHTEWFKVTLEQALVVIRRWRKWMIDEPYQVRELRSGNRWHLEDKWRIRFQRSFMSPELVV